MTNGYVWILPGVALLLLILQYFFPLRDFTRRSAFKNILFHAGFAAIIFGEVTLLSLWEPLPKVGLLGIFSDGTKLSLLVCILSLDLLSYFWHRLNHSLRWLWKFHSFHHKSTTLDPLMAYRFHPVEVFFGFQLRALIIWALGFQAHDVALFVIFYGALNLFQHSNLRLPKYIEEPLALIFVTPTRHHVHHLRNVKCQNSNLSTVFIFWDRLFGTYMDPVNPSANDIGLDRSAS